MIQKSFPFILLFFFTSYLSNSQAPGWKWGRSGIGKDFEHTNAITTDIKGNAIVAGYFVSDTLLIGSNKLYNSAASFDDAFIAKYDSTGNVLWARSIGGSADDKSSAVTTDALGNIYLAGYFYSPTLSIGSFTLTNAGAVGDIFLVKYDPNGNLIWAKREGGTALEIPYSITLDGAGKILLTGRYSSASVTFGTTTLTLAGANDIFLVKFDTSGAVLWAKGAGSSSIDEGFAVCTDALNNIYVTGQFNQKANFGSLNVTSAGQSDIFLAKYDASGNIIWVRRYGSSGDDRANALNVDANGNCYLFGFFKSASVNFGVDSVTNFFVNGTTNALLLKTDSSGKVLWSHGINGKSTGYGITTYRNHVYACGSFTNDSMNYGTGKLAANGSGDFFLLHCDTSGNSKWIINQTSGGGSSESANAIAVDAWGNIFIGGEWGSHDPVGFGSDILNSTSNSYDFFVARLGNLSTGLQQFSVTDVSRIYPNPNHGKFILASMSQIKSIKIFNASGQKVFEEYPWNPASEYEVNLTSLPPGIYFVEVNNGEIRTQSKIVILND